MSHRRRLTISVETHPAAADAAFIREQLNEFNRSKAGDPGREFGVFARNGGGKIIGGLIARVLYQWMYISEVYVVASQRGFGVGERLL